MNFIKKHKYKLLSLLTLLVLLLWGWNLFMTRGGELMFDMKEINGVTDNNPYGIRNDVYEYVTKELEENSKNHPELKDPVARNLYYNATKFDLMEIKYFSNKEVALEIGFQNLMILNCIYQFSEEKRYHKFKELYRSRIGHIGRVTNYHKVVYKTEDHELISKIVNSYFNGKVLTPKGKNTYKNPELCDKYKEKVLSEEEILTPHSARP